MTVTHARGRDFPALIRLEPVLHSNVWGGRRLVDEWGYAAPDGPVGECWGVSAHPHGDCRVLNPGLGGMTLSGLWAARPDLFGGRAGEPGSAPGGERFPLLVKVIDAARDLSVQVHPGDAYAREHEAGSLGKAECWYVLDAPPGAGIVVGQRARSRAEFEHAAREGAWGSLLNEVPIRPGSFVDVGPGTVHAIRAGTLLVEVQQSSDVTYRLYDYGRLGPDGRPRELHVGRALDVIDFDAEPPVSTEVVAPERGGMTELVSNGHFTVLRVRAPAARVLAGPWPFLCVSVVSGEGAIAGEPVARGDHMIATAGSAPLALSGEMELICCHV